MPNARSVPPEIGKRIRALREAQNLTQGALAAKTYVTQPAVSQWEKGRTIPGLGAQFLLADVLHTTRSTLFRELVGEEAAA